MAKISAAAARAHTRKKQKGSGFAIPKKIVSKLSVVLLVGLLAWSYQAIRPPPPNICGLPNGPSVTSSRIKLKDGRHISYMETGLPKEKARHKIIFVHGFDSCKHDVFPISQKVLDELGVYLLSFDRAGYGESDPNPEITSKSIANDIEELADNLLLGPKFFVMGFSMGGAYTWSCLKYISHRLAGAALVTPASNYWWPSFPSNFSKEAYKKLLVQDQWALRVAHYTPWLTYWWNTQKWFPYTSVIAQSIDLLSDLNKELQPEILKRRQYQVRQQGEYYSLHLDLIVCFGSWDFDPLLLENPFPHGEGSVHIWHGDQDLIVDVSLSRFISEKLPWVRYHEVSGADHMFPHTTGISDSIVKTLVLGDQ
ncbi:hypothetical protein AXF42_Ash013172 [Apostasia shenzhenica]|uniref:AB hydrolase-1 domain-containing protein n=1 Tax=Apostasia shenzhenica TaxID=1088818 RepID=A0A2I0BD95_9ASPA|nr:hypothetical protein AXF42_Ash013172 [Apostasia shenzhenica]